MSKNDIGFKIGEIYIGPMIFSYVKWVLDSALEKNIYKLYFLARDGYLMYKCAKILCTDKKYSNIECKYFYCSRISLRLPTYYILSYGEVIESLFSGGYNVSLDRIFERILLDDNEKKSIINDMNLKDTNKVLSMSEFELCKQKFNNCQLVRHYVKKKSKQAYLNTTSYIKQEGMIENENFAIVDSGWSGTLQKSLLLLLKSMGFKKKLIGFYFGMYADIENSDDNEYNPYYFNGKSHILRKAQFNNSIFEIVCSGNHGMTKEYTVINGKSRPSFAEYRFCTEKEEIKKGALSKVEIIDKIEIQNRIKKLMVYPPKDYAEYIGEINFSDDLSDSNISRLAPIITNRQCKNLLLPVRAYMLKNKDKHDELRMYWSEGAVVRSNIKAKKIFILNVQLWNIIKFALKKY